MRATWFPQVHVDVNQSWENGEAVRSEEGSHVQGLQEAAGRQNESERRGDDSIQGTGDEGAEGPGRVGVYSVQSRAGRVPSAVPHHIEVPDSCSQRPEPGPPELHLPGSRTSFWEVMQSTCTFMGGTGPIWPRACRWKPGSALI